MILQNKRDREAWDKEKSIESLKENEFLKENDIVEVVSKGFYKIVRTETDIPLKNKLYAEEIPSEILGTITNAQTADKLSTAKEISLTGDVSGKILFDGSENVSMDTTITSVEASKITGIIDISNLPKTVSERCILVENDEARFALTKDQVQNGDSVKVINPYGIMYAVIDDTKLNSEDGYTKYSSITSWEAIENKPNKFSPEEHNHNLADDKTDGFLSKELYSKLVNLNLSDLSFSNPNPALNEVGGIGKGTTFDNVPIVKIFEDMFYKVVDRDVIPEFYFGLFDTPNNYDLTQYSKDVFIKFPHKIIANNINNQYLIILFKPRKENGEEIAITDIYLQRISEELMGTFNLTSPYIELEKTFEIKNVNISGENYICIVSSKILSGSYEFSINADKNNSLRIINNLVKKIDVLEKEINTLKVV